MYLVDQAIGFVDKCELDWDIVEKGWLHMYIDGWM